MSSIERTCFFTGSSNDPRALSGKSDVRQVVTPILASTRMLPKALRCFTDDVVGEVDRDRHDVP